MQYDFGFTEPSDHYHQSNRMLQGYPTKKGTGIAIYGDYYDLRSLYLTVLKIREKVSQVKDDPQSLTLAAFSYELRKAYSEQRLKEEFTFDGDRKIEYLGFQYLWTDLVIFLNVLRYVASYTITNELDQTNLYLLEHVTKTALEGYDPEGAVGLKDLMGQRINVADPLLCQINEFVNIEYLKMKPSKARFRCLHSLISNHFSSYTREGKELRQFLDTKAKEIQAPAAELSFDDKEFPDVVW